MGIVGTPNDDLLNKLASDEVRIPRNDNGDGLDEQMHKTVEYLEGLVCTLDSTA